MALATLRRETDNLVRLADKDLSRLWRLVADGASAETALRDLLPTIITEYGQVGAAMAAEWYDEQRLKVDAKGRFVATPIAATDRGAQSLVGWAVHTATDDAALQALVLGGLQRRLADHVRDTITTASVQDRAADGWQRVGSGECDFCSMLISRGEVYSEATADFASHDHCNCSAVPAFGGEPQPVRRYTPSLRQSDADQARAREWIASH